MKHILNTISTRDVAAATGINHLTVVKSVERNMEAMIEVCGYSPIKKVYSTRTRNGYEYLLYPEQECLFLLLSNNVSESVYDYKVNLASSLTAVGQKFAMRDLTLTVESYKNHNTVPIDLDDF